MGEPVGLRFRLFGSILIALLIGLGASVFAVWQFIETFEDTLISASLRDRMAEFAAAYTEDPRISPPRSAALHGYIAPGAQATGIPRWLDELGPGIHEDFPADGKTYFVLRHDIGATRLYLTQDVDALEQLEATYAESSFVGLLLAVAIAGIAAWAIARIVLGPLLNLAGRISRFDPGQRGARIGRLAADREVIMIAGAFDAYLDQLDAFVAREQAFTGDVSHELRTPLATILSATQLMLTDPALPDDLRPRLQRVERAAEHMHELISAMLFLARQPDAAERKPCDIGQILRDIVESYRELAESGSTDLRLAVITTDTVHAPPGMLTSVVGNLVGNAVEHASGGRVEVSLQGRMLTVSDDGPGIPGREVTRIFERGYRGRKSRGTGLGLALVRRICDHLGWIIEIDSSRGSGTCIRVRF